MSVSWFFFFFKQKTAYEMRISDWSSDVCSSDLDRSPSLRLEPFEAGAYAMLGAGVRQQQGFHVVSRKARRRPMLLPVNARLFLVQPLAEGVRVVGGAGRDDERTAATLAETGQERVFQCIALIQRPTIGEAH